MVSPLHTDQINSFFKRNKVTRPYFLGVYSRGDLPKKIPNKQCFLVLNTDKYDQVGIHWVLVYFKEGLTIFFCSYGNTPSIYNYDLIVQNKYYPLISNIQQVQRKKSLVCGYHVCLIGHLLSLDWDLSTILGHFYTLDRTLNDTLAVQLVLKLNNGEQL